MTREEANKIIAEFMGKCWHTWNISGFDCWCAKCGKDLPNKSIGKYNGYKYTESLDALVPVWEKLEHHACIVQLSVYRSIPWCNVQSAVIMIGAQNGKTIYEAAAIATAKAILEMKKCPGK